MPKEKTNLDGLNILLGVTGGVAAYKAVDLASKVTAAGANVKTVMTQNACKLIGPKSFEAVTRSTVYVDLWAGPQQDNITHISLADWADIVVVSPATANIIAKAANAICDDLLSTILCACWAGPTLIAPAMNSNMWENPAVQRNVKAISEMGFILIGPETGRLACGTEGAGRMSEPSAIIEQIVKIASQLKK